MNIRTTLRCGLASTALALLSSLSHGQSPGAMSGVTPKEIQDGSATLVGHADPNQQLRLVIGLEHPNPAAELQFRQELHTKGSPNFQRFLTAEQWNSRFAPSAQDEQAVVDWAASQGLAVTHRFANRLLVDVEGSAAAVERAFGVTINRYQLGSRSVFSNDRDPVIPSQLKLLIHSIGGLNSIQVAHPMTSSMREPAFADYTAGPAIAKGPTGGANASRKRPAAPQAPNSNVTNGYYDPTDLYSAQAYDFNALNNQGHCCNPDNNSGVTPPSSSIAIATAGTQNGSDFAGFQAQYPYLAYHYQQYYIDGTPNCCDDEGTLDFEWSTAMANSFGSYVNTAMVYLYDGVNNYLSTFTDVYNHILSDGHARVFSTSWGCEERACTSTSTMDTDDGIFGAMIDQGWTLVAASGDQGASAGCGDATAVQYPASDPNVVGAGGNTLYAAGTFSSETGWQGGTGAGSCANNHGGSTGGFSSYYLSPGYQSVFNYYNRAVPDIALNASIGQNYYFNGTLSGVGGTSIVAPEVAGLFAQTNAYLDYVATINGGCYEGTTCSPIGNGNWYLYYFGEHTYAPHYPFYDVTSGCNSNDITAKYGLDYYCAGSGYDEVTGWGSFNALQLVWGIIAYRAGDFGAPNAAFSSNATPGHWYNSDRYVEWTLTDTSGDGLNPVGVSGFTNAWDNSPPDSYFVDRPATSDGYFTGPASPTSSYGYQYVSSAGQGCHTTYVRGYDNSGSTQVQSFGPVCYDTVPPATTATLSGTLSGSAYTTAVKVTLKATDAESGVAKIYESVDGAAYAAYAGPFSVGAPGSHTLKYYSVDVAGNSETAHSLAFVIKSPTKTTVTSSLNPSTYGLSVKLTAKVAPTFGAAAAGTVTFKNGSTTLGTGALSGGEATYTTAALPEGSNAITAVYTPSSYDLASTSAVLTETVKQTTSTTAIAASVNASIYGQPVTFTATVASAHGGSVGGTVTFMRGSVALGTVAVDSSTNKAAYTTATLSSGTHSIDAVYNGSADDTASTSPSVSVKVGAATSTAKLASSANPSNAGEAVTLTATIVPQHGGAATGTVMFKDGATILAKETVNSSTDKAAFSTSALGAGTHSITAVYSGDSNVDTSTSAVLSQVVK